jgi:hypothetical protein
MFSLVFQYINDWYETSGSHGTEDVKDGLLGCDTMLLYYGWLPAY